METAGALYDGEIVWGLARLPDTADIVKGDESRCYILLTNNHRYGKSISTMLTPVRVQCWNTLTAALQGAAQKAVVRFAHHRTFDADLAISALQLASNRFNDYVEKARFLATKKMEDEQFQRFLKRVFPVNGEDAKKQDIPSLPATRAYDALATQPGAELGAGTWWAGYNAATFVVDHVLGQSVESRLNSAWYGPNAEKKRKAFNLALEYAEAA
jgi:phage/plasmid-like protein (TIGR03299 family)